MRQLNGQMVLSLFNEEREQKVWTIEACCEFCMDWLCKYYDCSRDEITPLVERLYNEFSRWEAFERSKVLKDCHGKHQIHGWSLQDAVDVCGIFDHSIDYHTCWDRAWAGRNGFTKEEAANVIEWDYHKKEPIFMGRNSDDEAEALTATEDCDEAAGREV